MIEMFEKGKILIAPDLRVNDLMEKGFTIDDIEELIKNIGTENPRNNVFAPTDFKPEFITGLKKDYELLNELVRDWDKIEEDPKLDSFIELLRNELFRKDLNPSGKLVIFTESTDTSAYLEKKLNENKIGSIISVSSENRNKLFEIIQENFDANYAGAPKDDYSILISTDVLAEGVNLHRANMIVNYDTPWNATRLMQRVGRVNRIGSVAGVIRNYNFYPSQQGDEEIRLYSNALVKLQGFHSAFGEDTKIFTHEELIETFKLFEEGIIDEEDKRLFYLKFIREYKDNNPREFKRIKALPVKARTARKPEEAGKEQMQNKSVVFLKSSYKLEFYEVDENKKTNALTFLQAATHFEASAGEKGYPLPSFHFDQVQATLEAFEKDFLNATGEIVATTDKADAISAQARKFLREMKVLTKNDLVKEACESLGHLVESGTHTPLPNETRKIRQQLDKRQITYGQADNLLMMLAKKYDALNGLDGEEEIKAIPQSMEPFIRPDIVISETFVA
jgi:superfamily II DNA/RNA helicase